VKRVLSGRPSSGTEDGRALDEPLLHFAWIRATSKGGKKEAHTDQKNGPQVKQATNKIRKYRQEGKDYTNRIAEVAGGKQEKIEVVELR